MEPASDKPWNEAEWERFMQRSDVRSARFGDLLETLENHPDRDEIIAKEMGWDRPDEHDQGIMPIGDSQPPFDYYFDDNSGDSVLETDETESLNNEELQPVEDIPAYKLAYKVGLEVHRALKPYMEAVDADTFEECDERIQSAYIQSLIPAAKIAGGHGIGYEDEAICGNIVCLRRALQAAIQARHDCRSLTENHQLPSGLGAKLSKRLDEVCKSIEQRIAELRARVWWD